MEIFWRTELLAGSMRKSVPASSETIQTESSLSVMPPSLSPGPNGRMAMILFVAGSTRARDAGFPQSGTQSVPNAKVKPEHGSAWNSILATMEASIGLMR